MVSCFGKNIVWFLCFYFNVNSDKINFLVLVRSTVHDLQSHEFGSWFGFREGIVQRIQYETQLIGITLLRKTLQKIFLLTI